MSHTKNLQCLLNSDSNQKQSTHNPQILNQKMTPRENILIPFAVTTQLSILFLGHCFQFFVNPLRASLAGGTKLCGNDNKNRENRSFRRWPALQATGVPFAAPSAETTCRSLPPRADDQCRANRRPPTTGGHLRWIYKTTLIWCIKFLQQTK